MIGTGNRISINQLGSRGNNYYNNQLNNNQLNNNQLNNELYNNQLNNDINFYSNNTNSPILPPIELSIPVIPFLPYNKQIRNIHSIPARIRQNKEISRWHYKTN